MFTDIEGSTRRWDTGADSMRQELARHDAIVRGAVDAAGGQVLKSMGDGFLAVFERVGDAADAAVNTQRALSAQQSLAVRMGIHTGAADERDGDYFGPTLNRGARLMAAAHGGQIVVSEVSAGLLADALPEGATLRDLGVHRLRDLSREERIFQIEAPGLRSDFDPLRTVSSTRTNLPASMTSLLGREDALVDLSGLVQARRMVTVTGVGGVGKTRLALEVARGQVESRADGVWLVELATAASAEELVQVVAEALTVSLRPGMTLEGSVLESIREKDLLLVLDNCEHLLEPVADLADAILRSCPGVGLLATSREGLGVDGEQIWPLRSLTTPTAGAMPDETMALPATLLFVERARAARPSFEVDGASVEPIAEICRRLDGIPLAIELAAARAAAMAPSDIAGHLDERFRLLTGGRRGAAERHQTLRAAVEWSYSLLTPTEQSVFDAISVFAGTFDTEGATAVAEEEGSGPWDVIDALSSLVSKSMLTAEAGPTTRYRQLETLRQYGAAQLEAAGGPDRARRRHATYFADFVEAATDALTGRDEFLWADRLAADLDNVRAALGWALEGPDAADLPLGLRIAAACALESNSGRVPWAGVWAEKALERTTPADPGQRCASSSAPPGTRSSAGTSTPAGSWPPPPPQPTSPPMRERSPSRSWPSG